MFDKSQLVILSHWKFMYNHTDRCHWNAKLNTILVYRAILHQIPGDSLMINQFHECNKCDMMINEG